VRGWSALAAPGTTYSVTSLYVWGTMRDEVNRLALRAAQGMDPRFAWVEVSDPQIEGLPASAPEGGIGAPSRAFAPPPGVSTSRMWTYLQPNGQRRAAQELQSFLKISEPIQQAIGQLLSREGPRVLVVANLERLREFFCAEEAGPHPFIRWLNEHDITLVATSTGGPLREGIHFDYLVTEPEATLTVVSPPLVAICQRGEPSPSFLQQIFRPHEVVCLSGLCPSALPNPIPAPRVAKN
jgi:hypothetical protein